MFTSNVGLAKKHVLVTALIFGFLACCIAAYIDFEVFRDYGYYKDYAERGIIHNYPILQQEFSNSQFRLLIGTLSLEDNLPDEDIWYPIVYGLFGILLLRSWVKFYVQHKDQKLHSTLLFIISTILAAIGWILGIIFLLATGLIQIHCC